MQDLSAAQASEVAKYADAYRNPDYRMGPDRLAAVRRLLAGVPRSERGSFLDVGCGRGESLVAAVETGYGFVMGTEVVDALLGANVVRAVAWTLPCVDREFDVVGCFDVLEHLLPNDHERTVREFGRVAALRILLTIGMHSSADWGQGELHVGLRTEADWTSLLNAALPGWKVRRRPDGDAAGISAAWEAEREAER